MTKATKPSDKQIAPNAIPVKGVVKLLTALAFYAEPETYHAIAFIGDPTCGEFMDDFSDDHNEPEYDRKMPGKLARNTLRSLGLWDIEDKGDTSDTPETSGPSILDQIREENQTLLRRVREALKNELPEAKTSQEPTTDGSPCDHRVNLLEAWQSAVNSGKTTEGLVKWISIS